MIAKSDVFIIALSSAVLVAGIVRWQSNVNISSNPQIATSSQSYSTNPVSQATQAVSANVANNNQTSVSSENANLLGSTRTSGQITSAVSKSATVIGNVSSNSNTNLVNERSVVPSSGNRTTDPGIAETGNNSLLYGTHRVVSGDYLAKIAQAYGTTVQTLQTINNLSGTVIYVDQEIKYPLPAN